MGKLDGKTALITGGTSGIGEAMAKLFAKEGANVIIVGRSVERGNRILEQLLPPPDGFSAFLPCDITDAEAVKKLRKDVEEKYSRLDILVNNAGISIGGSIEELQDEIWMRHYDVNMHASMRVTRAFLDMILESKGNILFDASVDGLSYLTRGRRMYAYSSTKAALIKFAQLLALNYTPNGIRVNCICPGATQTPIFSDADTSGAVAQIPMGRMGQPEEIANAALFLVSDDASYISGVCLPVDGAASLR